jgi:hypothetical protein
MAAIMRTRKLSHTTAFPVFITFVMQANPSLMKYGILLCTGKKLKKTSLKKKLSTMTDAQIQSIFLMLADDVERELL